MTRLANEINFPETDRQAIRNLAAAQANIMAVMEGIVQQMDDENIQILWKITEALNASVEVYCG